MILVTVGTHNHGFNRLVQAMDELAAELDEQVIIQRGSSAFEPIHAEHFDWAPGQRMEQLNREARIIIMHAAAGSILTALLLGKALIVVPRQQQYGECIDNHQRQLATALHTQGRAIAVYQPSKEALHEAIQKAAQLEIKNRGATQLVAALNQQLTDWNVSDLKTVRPIARKS